MPATPSKRRDSSSDQAAATHPQFDKKGTPKDPKAKRVMEKAHGRYSASEQSEARRR